MFRTAFVGAVTLMLAACATSRAPAASRFELVVLGTAQDGGRPHLGCEALCCESARTEARVDNPACIGIHDRESGALVMIEATPAIEPQVAMLHRAFGVEGRARRPVDALLLTHAHIGHYVGLAQLGREVASTNALPVFVTPRFAAYLRANGPWSQLVTLGQIDLREIDTARAFEPIPGLSVEAIPVPHRDEFSDTVAYRVRGPNRCVLFVPDVDSWDRHPGLLEKLLEGVDVAYIDGTFYDGRELPGRDLREIPHPFIVDTMHRLAQRAEARPGSVRFLHLNHSNPLWLDERLVRELDARGFAVAQIGERVGL
jgi:pyrroloquinoline quinone biosynthesis protein B